MNSAPNPALAQFVDAWRDAVTKSIAMFTGLEAVHVDAPKDATPPVADGTTMWLSLGYSLGTSGRVWLGVPGDAARALSESMADNDQEREALTRELLGQSLQAAGESLAQAGFTGLKSAEPLHAAPPAGVEPAGTYWFRVDAVLLPIALSHDAGLVGMLAAADAPPVAAPEPPLQAVAEMNAALTDLERFSGVELTVRIVIGRAPLRLRDIVKLTVGSLIELKTKPGDPVDICIHDAVVARGEVVSIRGNYGVRITEVLNARDRGTLERRGRPRPPQARIATTSALVH